MHGSWARPAVARAGRDNRGAERCHLPVPPSYSGGTGFFREHHARCRAADRFVATLHAPPQPPLDDRFSTDGRLSVAVRLRARAGEGRCSFTTSPTLAEDDPRLTLLTFYHPLIRCSARSVTCYRSSTKSSTIRRRTLQPWWPKSTNELSGKPGTVHAARLLAPQRVLPPSRAGQRKASSGTEGSLD